MIVAALAFAAVLSPQEPVADLLRAIHHDIDATARVTALEKRIAKVGDGRVPGIHTPALATELREAGLGAVDLAAARVSIGEEASQIEAAFALARSLMGLKEVAREGAKVVDIDEFERVCDHGYRDLHKALGSGRNLDEVAPWLHSAVDQVRASISNLSQIDAEQEKLLRERMTRLDRVDMGTILAIAEQITRSAVQLDREDVIAALRKMPERDPRADRGVSGKVLIDSDSGFGHFVVGGFGPNSYDMTQIDVLIDPGGDDEYRGPAGGAGEFRRMGVVVDLAGDDTYAAENDGLGSATFGIGVLVDVAGDDDYTSLGRSAGYGSGGVGVFVDVAGKDKYRLGDQVAAIGFGGVGMFLDLAGNDDMEAGIQSYGVGLPGGVGLFLDTSGDDRRVAGGEKKALTEQGDEQVSIAFGAGVGVMPFLSGGLGAFLDLGGHDSYAAHSLACGVGMRGGVGVFHEVWGNDVYDLGSVALGAAYGSGIGIALEDAGDDQFRAKNLSLGSALDGGVAFFLDRTGDDQHFAMGPTAGEAQRGAIGVCVDLRGEDVWRLAGGPAAWSVFGVQPVELPAVGVFLDDGGATDRYDLSRMAPPLPDNDRSRLVHVGVKDGPDVHLWLDR